MMTRFRMLCYGLLIITNGCQSGTHLDEIRPSLKVDILSIDVNRCSFNYNIINDGPTVVVRAAELAYVPLSIALIHDDGSTSKAKWIVRNDYFHEIHEDGSDLVKGVSIETGRVISKHVDWSPHYEFPTVGTVSPVIKWAIRSTVLAPAPNRMTTPRDVAATIEGHGDLRFDVVSGLYVATPRH